jgi:hypothetical protein
VALANYGDLKAAVANWLADDNITARIVEFVTLGEAQIFGDVRVRSRLLETTGDLTISSQTVSLPTGFIGVRRLYLNSSPVRNLQFLAPDQFWNRFISTTTDTPDFYTLEGENFVFGPSPDSTYTGKLLYWKKPTAFSADSDTNTFFTTNPDLYLYAALTASAPFLGDDPRLLTWSALYDNAADRIKTSNKYDRFPRGDSPMRSDYPIT